jgi:hypothetical protein
MSPCHWDFHYFELKILRQRKQCRIEAPPFNVLQQENRVGGTTSKSFEAALRILKKGPISLRISKLKTRPTSCR